MSRSRRDRTPHLGSASTETRRQTAEPSVVNLLAGLRGEPLVREIKPGGTSERA